MEELFGGLTAAVDGSPGIAMAASAAWGILSVVLSPCHLMGIPLLVVYIARRQARPRGDSMRIAGAYAVGIAVTIAVVAGITAAAGRIVGDLGPAASYIMAGVFLLTGLHLTGTLELPLPTGLRSENLAGRGPVGAFVLGLAFGSTLGPCTFAFMAPVLAASFGTAHASSGTAAALILAFGLGHCGTTAVLGASAGASAGLVQRWLAYGNSTRAIHRLRVAGGIVLILGGLYTLFTA